MRGHVDNPYIGINVFPILPIVCFTGLALIPPGIYFSKRNIQKRLSESPARTKPLARRTLRVYKSHTPVES
jgi:uncharacterized protein YneF (UPF0154 family)